MKTLRPASSLLLYFDDLVFLEATLLARPETQAMAAEVTALLAEFPTVLQDHLEVRRKTAQANARIAMADLALDGGIRALHVDALHAFGQNRKAPGFAALFSSSIGEVVRHALGKQIAVAQKLADTLQLDVYPQVLKDHAPRLFALIEAGTEQLQSRAAAEVAAVGQRLKVSDWKQDANAVRLSVWGTLLALAGKSGFGKRWADAFFAADVHDEPAAAEAVEPDPAPAPPA